MEGLNSIKKLWKLYFPDLRQELIAMLAGGIFGIIVTMCFMKFLDTASSEGYITLGSFIALWIGICMTAFTNFFSFPQKFNLAVSMGCTRKNFFLCYWIVNTLFTAAEILFVMGLAFAETGLGRILYADSFLMDDINLIPVLADYRVVTSILLFVPIFGMLLGILYLKFQVKAFWALWAFWMLFSLTGSKISKAISANPDSIPARIISGIGNIFMTMGSHMALPLILAVSILLFAISAILLRRQAVIQP